MNPIRRQKKGRGIFRLKGVGESWIGPLGPNACLKDYGELSESAFRAMEADPNEILGVLLVSELLKFKCGENR